MGLSQRVVCICKGAATTEREFSLLLDLHTREDSQRISSAILGNACHSGSIQKSFFHGNCSLDELM